MLFTSLSRSIRSFISQPQLTQLRRIQIDVSQVKKGHVLSLHKKLWVVLNSSHHRQARGGAHYNIEVKELLTGSKSFERFNSGNVVEAANLERRTFQFLYADDTLHLIDPVTFEEHEFPFNILSVGEKIVPFLQDSMEIKVEYHEDKPVLIKIPDRAIFTIKETNPASHSAADSSNGVVFKTAVLENGASISIPDFVNVGDKVVVVLSDQSYHSRVRE